MSQQYPPNPSGYPQPGPQQPYPQPGAQQPYPQSAPGPAGQLVVNMRKPFGLLSASLMSPIVKIDGYPAPARWEANAYPVHPGRHQVQASTSYMWTFGAAELPVDVAPGQSVEVHYSSPLITFMSGKIGFVPQPRPGMLAFWIIMAIPIVIFLIVIIGIVGSALSS